MILNKCRFLLILIFCSSGFIEAINAKEVISFQTAGGKQISESLIGDEVHVIFDPSANSETFKLLQLQKVVKVSAQLGNLKSWATFEIQNSEVTDLSLKKPVAGTFSSIDPDGFFWSMSGAESPLASLDVFFQLEIGDLIVAKKTLIRRPRAEGVRVVDIKMDEEKFWGRLLVPPGKGPFPGLIVLGGGEGGLMESSQLAAFYASRGYAALAVAYFRNEGDESLKGLPTSVRRIPFEYFNTAVQWLKKHESVKGRKIGILGGSRGGEAALFVGTGANQDISAIVSQVGSPIPMGDFNFQTNQEISPWTFKGSDLPFLSNLVFNQETYRDHPEDNIKSFKFSSTRNWELLKNPWIIKNGVFPIEKARAPILLLGAEDDALWPSSSLMAIAAQRLKEKKHPYEDQFFSYPNVGHVLGSPPGFPSPKTYFQFSVNPVQYWELGGETQANALAQRDSINKILAFLGKHLSQ